MKFLCVRNTPMIRHLFTVVILIALLRNSAAITCDPGNYLATYGGLGNPSDVQQSCQPCPEDTYMDHSNSDSQCTACPTGRSTSGATGSVSVAACSGAASCEAGFYVNPGTDLCTPCPVGTYTSDPNLEASCSSCTTGYTTGDVGSTYCDACAAGYRVTGDFVCSACPADTYTTQANVQSTCQQCPAGSTTNGATGASACTYCQPGYYLDDMLNSCQQCPVNTYQASIGRPGACTACPSGGTTNGVSGATSSSQCAVEIPAQCDAGSFVDVVGKKCSQCPVDTYTATTTTNILCTACPQGSTTNGASGSTSCSSCQPGYFVQNGICTVCPVDTYQNVVSTSATCTACDAGTTTGSVIGASSATQCKQKTCVAGTFLNTTTYVCETCPADTFTNSANSKPSCDSCAEGFSTFGISGAVSCTNVTYVKSFILADNRFLNWKCPPGTFINSATQTCDKCSPGSYSANHDNSQCTQCVIGSYAPDFGSSVCVLCPLGTFGNVTGASSATTGCFSCDLLEDDSSKVAGFMTAQCSAKNWNDSNERANLTFILMLVLFGLVHVSFISVCYSISASLPPSGTITAFRVLALFLPYVFIWVFLCKQPKAAKQSNNPLKVSMLKQEELSRVDSMRRKN